MKKLIVSLAVAGATMLGFGATMATRTYVDNATNAVVATKVPFNMRTLSGTDVTLDNHITHYVNITGNVSINLPAARPASDTSPVARGFNVIVECNLSEIPAGAKFLYPGLTLVSCPDVGTDQNLAIEKGFFLYSFMEISKNTFLFTKSNLEVYWTPTAE